MKTKIIYISGGELFEMAQIRAAFEEVKSTLGLDKDTVLFGVPVDCDSAIEEVADNTHETPVVVAEPVAEMIPDATEIPEIPEIPQVLQEVSAEIATEDVSEIATEDAPVVPILSVLATNDEEIQPESVAEQDDITEISDVTEPVVDIVEPVTAEPEEILFVSETVSVDDIADDDTPDIPMEKTLEQLLESMTPLREDITPKEDIADSENVFEDTTVLDASDTDATLAQLASEFALTEDKIAPAPRAETSGKIGKLKNILPFKKAKREDNSLMGDLFGWAGIAANDEDFSIPGFFTPAKKQGA